MNCDTWLNLVLTLITKFVKTFLRQYYINFSNKQRSYKALKWPF